MISILVLFVAASIDIQMPPINHNNTTPVPTPTPVSGAFYVATNGNDANLGTEAQPWRTIQKAADTLTAGQTVYVKTGTYNEQVTIQNSGSADNWITFTSYPGQTATIDGVGISMDRASGRSALIQIYGKDYIRISNLRLINSDWAAFLVTSIGGGLKPSSNIIFSNNYIEKTWGAAIVMMGLGNVPARNFIVDGNTLVQSHYSDDAIAHEGISIGGDLDGFEVKNNIIRDSLHGAIDAKDGAHNGKIYRNTCTTTTYSCVYIDGYGGGTSDIDIYENVVHDMKSQNVDDVSNGFSVASEQGGGVRNIRFYNNIVYNNPGIAFIIPWYSTGTIDNVLISSNTFVNNGIGWSHRGGITLDYPPATNIVVRNNIVSQNNQYQLSNRGVNAIFENNLIDGYKGYTSEVRGISYVEGNPLFMNLNTANFHLQALSPAINKGSPVNAPAVDFDGRTRPYGLGYDMGAFEYRP
ncbi:MAG: right-handed parallel beta-helix repeat-containing protein [Pedobacter sp.]|uniref:choice-of-anchor Q domain-containing protein n=1 Tax=Pedobacter sp. TaxID=1411316 RepID=UPI0035695C2B